MFQDVGVRQHGPRVAGVKIAISNYRRQNHMVDENNAEHVAAYILLRETQMRVSGKMLVDYLESLRTTVSHGDLSTFSYLGGAPR